MSLRVDSRLTLLTLAWLAGVGCGEEVRPETPPLCYRGNPPEHAGMTRELQPEEWISLILKAHPGETASLDCTGTPIRWPAPDPGCPADETASSAMYEPVILGEDSVVVRRLPTGQQLVWVLTHVRSDGFALGPVALIDTDDRGTAVRAIGSLRGRYERVRLALWPIGDGQLLAAEAETCSDPADAKTCQRGVQLLPRLGDAFRWTPLRDAAGKCIDGAWVELKRAAEVARADGWIRNLDYTASLQNDRRYLVVTEQVTIHDRDPRDPEATPRLVRRVDTERFYHLAEGHLTSRQTPLWPATLAGWGSMNAAQKSNAP